MTQMDETEAIDWNLKEKLNDENSKRSFILFSSVSSITVFVCGITMEMNAHIRLVAFQTLHIQWESDAWIQRQL